MNYELQLFSNRISVLSKKISIFLLWFVCIYYPYIIIDKLRFNHLVLMSLFIFSLCRIVVTNQPISIKFIWFTCVYILLNILQTLFFGVELIQFSQTANFIFLLYFGLFFSMAYSKRQLLVLLSYLPLVLTLFLIMTNFHHLHVDYSDNRLSYYDSIGSPNTVGFLISLSILLLLNNFAGRRPLFKLFNFAMVMLLGYFLFLCKSRSATFGLVLAIIAYLYFYSKSGKLYKIGMVCLLSICSLGLISILFGARFDLGSFFSLAGSSGRLVLWGGMLSFLVLHPISFFFGYGPRGIQFLNIFNVHYQSFDSMLMWIWFEYGFLFLLYILIYFFNKVRKIFNKMDTCQISIGVLLLFTSLVNGTVMASQIMLVGALLIGFVLNERVERVHFK